LVQDSAIYNNLYRYIQHIHFTEINTSYQLNTQLTSHPNYFFLEAREPQSGWAATP